MSVATTALLMTISLLVGISIGLVYMYSIMNMKMLKRIYELKTAIFEEIEKNQEE